MNKKEIKIGYVRQERKGMYVGNCSCGLMLANFDKADTGNKTYNCPRCGTPITIRKKRKGKK